MIANGDVFCAEDYRAIKEHTGAAGVMIARGALGRPQIFAEITGRECPYRTVRDMVVAHIETLLRFHSETYAVNNMKKQVACYCKGLRGGKQLKLEVFAAKTADQLLRAVDCGVLDVPAL